jgi:hypothetical protein
LGTSALEVVVAGSSASEVVVGGGSVVVVPPSASTVSPAEQPATTRAMSREHGGRQAAHRDIVANPGASCQRASPQLNPLGA